MRKSIIPAAILVILATLGSGCAQGSTTATVGLENAESFILARIISGQEQYTARATLKDAQGTTVGEALFTDNPQSGNGVEISVGIRQGIEPGEHGIHIHETNDVSSGFEAVGAHFNPTGGAQHGFDNPEGAHAGDLENITVSEDGTASYQTTTDRVTLASGENSLLDEDGSALVIHARADDYETDPDGGSGDRVAAGAIENEANTVLLVGLVALVGVGLLGLLVFWRVRKTSKKTS